MAQAWPVPRHRGALWLCPCGRNHAFFERSPLSFGRYHATKCYTAHRPHMPKAIRVYLPGRRTYRRMLPWYAQAIPVFVFCLVQFRECTGCRQQQMRVAWQPGDWSKWGHYTSERMRQIMYALDVKTGVETGKIDSIPIRIGTENAENTHHTAPHHP